MIHILTMLLNDTINIFLIIPNIIFLYYFYFIKYLWISNISLVSIGVKLTKKYFTLPFNPVLLVLLIVKSSEISPKHSE